MANLGSETISALKTSPMLLVIVVLNVGMIFALLYVAKEQQVERKFLTESIIGRCGGANVQ